jgi:O-antigen/teichoic acid export membrane protein
MHSLKGAMILLRGKRYDDDANVRRYRSILRGGVSALIARGVGGVSTFVVVPLTLTHLGPERYGLWVTLYSIIAWLSLADFGIANGLMNALSEAFGKQRLDLEREYVSVAFWGLCLLALIIGTIFIFVSIWIDWASLLNINTLSLSEEFAIATRVGIVIFMMGLPLSVVGKVYVAFQQGEIANVWAIISSLGGLVGLTMAVFLDAHFAAMVIGFSGGQLLGGLSSAIWLFAKKRPDLCPSLCFNRSSYRRVFHVGIAFFVNQLTSLMLFQSANIIILRYLGSEHVTSYQVTWVLFSYATLPQQLIGQNVWAAVGEAYAKDDIEWIRTLFNRHLGISLMFGIPLIFILAVFYEEIIVNWAGKAAVPPAGVVYWMAAWALLFVVMQPIIAVLGGVGKLYTYSLLTAIAAIVAVSSAVWAVTQYGAVGVISSIVLCSILLSVVPAVFMVRKLLSINRYCVRAVHTEYQVQDHLNTSTN